MGNRTAGISTGAMMLALLILLAYTVVLSGPVGPQVASRGGSDIGLAGVAPTNGGEGCMKEGAAGSALIAASLKGADLPALRQLFDPYSTFSEIAVDPENNRVVISDINRKSILLYDRSSGSDSSEMTQPRSQIIGPDTMVGFVAGVALDPERREIFAVNNDIEDSMAVFSYDQAGNAKPLRALVVPHQSWGISLARQRDEIAISVQQVDSVFVYRREANGGSPHSNDSGTAHRTGRSPRDLRGRSTSRNHRGESRKLAQRIYRGQAAAHQRRCLPGRAARRTFLSAFHYRSSARSQRRRETVANHSGIEGGIELPHGDCGGLGTRRDFCS